MRAVEAGDGCWVAARVAHGCVAGIAIVVAVLWGLDPGQAGGGIIVAVGCGGWCTKALLMLPIIFRSIWVLA